MGIPQEWKNELKLGTLAAYTSYGCYPLVYLSPAGDVLCADCTTHEIRSGRWMVHGREHAISQRDIHWEGGPILCDGCQQWIESAYGEPE